MPRAKILSHLGDGLYSVEIQNDWSILNKSIAKLQSELADTKKTGKEAEIQSAVDGQQSVLDDLNAELGSLISQLSLIEYGTADYESKRKEVSEATLKSLKQRGVITALLESLAAAQFQRVSKEKELARLQAISQTNDTVTAWACDYATGELSSTLEYDPPITYPVYAMNEMVDVYVEHREFDSGDGYPVYHLPPKLSGSPPSEIDPVEIAPINGKPVVGGVVNAEVLHGAAVYWNMAMLPGFQRWRPICRVGSLVEMDISGNGKVRLSPSRGLTGFLLQEDGELEHWFPIQYYCGKGAFRVADEVLVKITGWETGGTTPQGVIIGFANNPRACSDYVPTYFDLSNSYGYKTVTYGFLKRGVAESRNATEWGQRNLICAATTQGSSAYYEIDISALSHSPPYDPDSLVFGLQVDHLEQGAMSYHRKIADVGIFNGPQDGDHNTNVTYSQQVHFIFLDFTETFETVSQTTRTCYFSIPYNGDAGDVVKGFSVTPPAYFEKPIRIEYDDRQNFRIYVEKQYLVKNNEWQDNSLTGYDYILNIYKYTISYVNGVRSVSGETFDRTVDYTVGGNPGFGSVDIGNHPWTPQWDTSGGENATSHWYTGSGDNLYVLLDNADIGLPKTDYDNNYSQTVQGVYWSNSGNPLLYEHGDGIVHPILNITNVTNP